MAGAHGKATVIDLCDDDVDPLPAAAPKPGQRKFKPPSKRKRTAKPPANQPSAPAQSEAGPSSGGVGDSSARPYMPAANDSPTAKFSDDEEDPGDGGAAVRWDDDGSADFSHVRSFHAQQPACGMCGKPFQPNWNAQREELVVYDVVMLRGVLYHSECIRAAPPPTMPLPPPPPDPRESRAA